MRWLLALIVVTAAVWGLAFDQPAVQIRALGLSTPVAFVAATFANATAVGGGFLFLPYFTIVHGLSTSAALKLSLATQAFGMTSGAVGWSAALIDFRVLSRMAPGALLGMGLGTFVWSPPSTVVRTAFSLASVVVVIAVLVEARRSAVPREDLPPPPRLRAQSAWELGLGAVGGLITAWTSIGIGEVVALWLLFSSRAPVERAIATGVAALALCSALGLAMHAAAGGIEWSLLAFTAPGVLLGGYTGARMGRRLEAVPAQRRKLSLPWHLTPLRGVFLAVLILDSMVIWLDV